MGNVVYGILLVIAVILLLMEAFTLRPTTTFSKGWLGLAFLALAFLSQIIHFG